MGSWFGIKLEGWKSHYVPAELANDLVADYSYREDKDAAGIFAHIYEDPMSAYTEDSAVARVSEVSWDPGGAILGNRSYEHVPFAGVEFVVASEDLGDFLRELDKAPVREFGSGQEYIKIYGWMFCLVMTPTQRLELKRAITAILPEASARGRADDERFLNGLKRLNKDGMVLISHRDPSIKIEQNSDGSVSVKSAELLLSGLPTDDLN